MTLSDIVSWEENSEIRTAVWQSEAGHPPPDSVVIVDDTTKADTAYKQACKGVSMLYRGDFQNAKQLVQAVTRRIDRKKNRPAATMLDAFHEHRARQFRRAKIAGRILIELQHGKCELKRAPELREAVEGVLQEDSDQILVLSLRETLGMIGAHEWRKKGVNVKALEAKIHAHYGVYSPIRGEYLDALSQAPLDSPQIAWDIGCGTGVIAALLVARGAQYVVATDTSDRALRCAAVNFHRLQMESKIDLVKADLFPDGTADLIVCNPPWLPAKAHTSIERAVYDPGSRMLKSFLDGAAAHLNSNGEVWLVMSNLAENIGLRGPNDLQNWIAEAGLFVAEKTDIAPRHGKASDQSDPLYSARTKEVTSLYRLKVGKKPLTG